MALQDIQYAFRMFRRAPLAALTIVTMVALGLGLVAMARRAARIDPIETLRRE